MNLKRWFVGALAPLSLLFLLAAPAAAQTCVGTCGTDTANGDVTNPPGFSSYTYIVTNDGPVGGGNIPVGPIGPATNGSTLTTAAFTANAGSQLNYLFNYITSDGSGYPDYAWAELETAGGTPVALLFTAQTNPGGPAVPGGGLQAPPAGVTLSPSPVVVTAGSGTQGPGGPGGPVWAELGLPNSTGINYSGWCWAAGCGLTGWIASNYTIATGGSYELAFGVSNENDQAYDSGLAIAGVEIDGNPIATTPEPSTFLMLGLGLSTLIMFRRRKLALL